MLLMLAGFLLFFGTHLMQVWPALRASIIGSIGTVPYRIGYSLVALVGLILIVQGYSAWRWSGSALLYVPPVWLDHLAVLLMLPAFVLIIATYAPCHIRKWVRHPMITAVKIWAFAHLLANGHLAGVVMFGAFLVWAVVCRISVARRERAGLVQQALFEPNWLADVAAVAIGIILYGLFVWKVHLWLIGVSPIGM